MKIKDIIQENSSETLDQLQSKVQNELGIDRFMIHDFRGDIILDEIVVPKELRGQGIGSKAIEMLTAYADQVNKRIILTPSVRDKYYGTTSRTRLVKFYKQFGFKESKGRHINYAIGAGKMYRNPQ